jgi:EF-hand domain pair
MDGQQQIPRFEKVMRRMDGDGDGKLSPQEFKVALKRLHFKDERKWTLKMIKRLFDDIDSDRDGLLSVTEFSAMIQDLETPIHTEIVVSRHDHASDDDDEEDAIFTRQRVGSDTDLLKKVLTHSFKNILHVSFLVDNCQ